MTREESAPLIDESMQRSAIARAGSRQMDIAEPFESDEALAARGDADSFIRLYRTYLTPVYRYLYTRLGSRQEAEDAASLVFERAWSSLKVYRPVGSFRGWLFTIARRVLADHYRGGNPQSVQVDTLAGSLLDPAASPEEQALLSEQMRDVLGAIAKLGEEAREVITLRFMAGLRYSEIAAVMNKREPAVKMTAYRALEEIRRRCKDVE